MDPLDVSQWTFYVASARLLDEKCGAQQSITLSSLERLGPVKASYADIRGAVLEAAGRR